MVRIEWNERALEDLGEIREYIARDSKNYANFFVKKIYDAVQTFFNFKNNLIKYITKIIQMM